jgi:hypothetical protein
MNAIVRTETVSQLPAAAGGDGGPPMSSVGALMAIIDRAASDPNFDPVRLMQLLEVKERWDSTEARKAFVADMAEFKKTPPVIFKNKHVGFDSRRTGQSTAYDHATHAEVTYKIIAGLAQHGFSHRWVTTQPEGMVRVECVITHRLGHSESFSMVAPPDTSGSKSPVQAIASTKTLLERYTLLGATGLSTTDLPDADDRKTGDDAPEADQRPALAQDVVNALKVAAEMGTAELSAAFQKLAETTRARIVADYNEEWTALKAEAAKVKKGAKS